MSQASFCLPDFKVIKQHTHTPHTHTHTHTLPSLRLVFLPYWTGVSLSTHVTPHFLSHFCSLGDSKSQRVGIESVPRRELPGGPVVRTGHFHCKGLRFPPIGAAVLSAFSSTVLMGKLLCPSLRVCSVVSRFLWLHRLQPAWLLCPWNFPGKSTGVGCHFLLQEIEPKFPASLAWAGGLLTIEPPGKPILSESLFNSVAEEKGGKKSHEMISWYLPLLTLHSLFFLSDIYCVDKAWGVEVQCLDLTWEARLRHEFFKAFFGHPMSLMPQSICILVGNSWVPKSSTVRKKQNFKKAGATLFENRSNLEICWYCLPRIHSSFFC